MERECSGAQVFIEALFDSHSPLMTRYKKGIAAARNMIDAARC